MAFGTAAGALFVLAGVTVPVIVLACVGDYAADGGWPWWLAERGLVVCAGLLVAAALLRIMGGAAAPPPTPGQIEAQRWVNEELMGKRRVGITPDEKAGRPAPPRWHP